MSAITTEEKLKERVKELSCLYDISSAIVNRGNSITETLQQICQILKVAWRFGEKAIVELQLDSFTFFTSPLEQETIFQYTPISIGPKNCGYLKVHYPKNEFDPIHFLEEEQKLLDKVSLEISNLIEKEAAKEKEALLIRSAEHTDRLSILGETTAGIAHELNTPLGNILGFAELISQHTTDPQIANDVSKIINAAIYSREIVKKLMFFSADMPQKFVYLELEPVIKEALNLLEPNFKKAGITWTLAIDKPGIKAEIDPVQFTQILFNILINSLYASAKNSVITLNLYSDTANFYLEIADQGTGIAPEIQHKIFEPFFTTKPVGDGSGLGLSVVHGIIKRHNGEIIALANQPNGTIFKITLPLNLN